MHNYVPWMLACEEHSSGGTLVPPASVVRLNHLSVMQAAFVWNWVIVLQVWVCMTWSKKAKDEAEYYMCLCKHCPEEGKVPEILQFLCLSRGQRYPVGTNPESPQMYDQEG